MKIAVMSDVHANPSALRTALDDARRLDCTHRFFLGDVTGYGYDVKVALELIRANFDVSLLGNHDSVLLGREPPLLVMQNPNYDVDVRQRQDLSDEEKEWLGKRPLQHCEAEALFVHGEIVNPRGWGYILFPEDATRNFKAMAAKDARVLFCGHSHHAEVWERTPGGRIQLLQEKRLSRPTVATESIVIDLKPDHRYIVNVGSVGYARNDYCSTYAVYEPEANRVTVRRFRFDMSGYIERLVKKKIDLPEWLVRFLLRSQANAASAGKKKEGKK